MSARRSLLCGVVGLCAAFYWTSALSESRPSARLSLAAPSLSTWSPEFPSRHGPGPLEGFEAVAVITDREVTLYSSPGGGAVGSARLGNRLPANPSGDSCTGGTYYKVGGGAYLCSSGAKIVPADGELPAIPRAARARRPALEAATPHKYVKVTRNYSPRFDRLPSEAEIAKVPKARERRWSLDSLERWMNGTYLVAIADEVEVGGERLYRTVAGRYILAEDTEDKPAIEMRGEKLGGQGAKLPLAFITRDTDLYCGEGDSFRRCGEAAKHARFRATGRTKRGDLELVTGRGRLAAPAEKVRVIEAIERPSGVPDDAKWIHIHLSQQALVAYEGDEPVYATLVSSGLRSHATPNGLYRVDRKYVTKTMRGYDEDGLYVVQEVPWTMYYSGAYAVHGAYWHNNFGNTRSHGCVNVPPADARWIYHWSSTQLPPGWHSQVGLRGTYVYITGKTPPDVAEDESG